MPGSNDHSMDPELIDNGSSNLTYSPSPTSGNVVPRIATTPSKPVTIQKPSPFYQQKDFRTEKLAALKGMMSDRRASRVLNRYMKSESGKQAEADFAKAESEKYLASVDAFLELGKQRRDKMFAAPKPTTKTGLTSTASVNKPSSSNVGISKPVTKSHSNESAVNLKPVDWNAIAQKYGFADSEAVKQWQQKNGLVADGKFGKKSLGVWNAQQSSSKAPTLGTSTSNDSVNSSILPKTSNTAASQINSVSNIPQKETNKFNLRQFAQRNGLEITNQNGREVVRWDPNGFGDFWVDSSGNIYNGGRTFDVTRKFTNPAGLGHGERKNRYEALQDAILGKDATGDLGVAIVDQRPASKPYTNPPYRALYRKQGGTMNRINYFQQGGSAPKQDIRAQVTALVQAAMQGDAKANQQVNQIMEAAKAGNQQAVRLAQMITEVAKQLQGQATAAKWGAKLNYIQSLKFAKGGKTCPTCEKKVEMKACGGKKAKKRYFGGII